MIRCSVSFVILLGCHMSGDGTSDPGARHHPRVPAPEHPSGSAGSGDDACAVLALFSAECVVCHSPEGGIQGELDLATDPTGALVDHPSATYPGRTLVIPGDPDGSFLVAKISATQGADGQPMPPPTGGDNTSVGTVRAWVQQGAPDGCGAPPEPPESYHPDGFADAAVHGLATKLQQQECTSCHGADLTGGTSGVSCDGCHVAEWRATCTYCHGGVDNATGAPPENIDDTTGPLALFPAHTAHVEQTIHPAFGCDTCHLVPTDPLSQGHVIVGDSTPGEAEVVLAGGTFAGGTCSNVYCHGDGQTSGTVDASFVTTCDGCHPDSSSDPTVIDLMSGRHKKHVVGEGFDCSECHAATVDATHAIVDPAAHVDGAPTVATVLLTWDPAAETCTGTCHGETHNGRRWTD